MILINGLFPGPTLEMNQGDEVEVVVHNNMPFNTTLHFLGIEMYLTPWSDGVPGVTQRQIQPNTSFTCRWTATQYGSYWYHAHHRGQLDDGMYGALLIHPKAEIETPFEFITKDKTSLGAIKKAVAGLPSNLSAIHPEVFDVCSPATGSHEVIEVVNKACEKEKWLALDLIGAFGLHTALFSVDETSLWEYAVDGEHVEPQLVNAIEVTNGDRYSVLIRTTNLTPGDYTVRVISTTTAQFLTGRGTLSIKSSDTNGQYPRAPTTSPTPRTSAPYFLDNGVPISLSNPPILYSRSIERPFPPSPIAQKADKTFKLSMSMEDSIFSWTVNGTIFPQSIDSLGDPILFQPPPSTPSTRDNLTITTQNGTWVDLILQTATFPMPPHPMHKHGNKMRLIGTGEGPFTWETVEEAIKEIPEAFDLENPPKRDALLLRWRLAAPCGWRLGTRLLIPERGYCIAIYKVTL